MTEEEKQQKKSVVKTTSIVAAGCASVVAALFTSKLGVAGTLVGTAMTSMVITLASAILNAQFERASTRISGLPSTVRGRLSTQQVRVPGRPSAEPNPEPTSEEPYSEPSSGERRSDRRSAGFLERLRSIPDRLKAMSPATRRRVLVSGALAGIAATAIGLSIITFTEVASGQSLTNMVWSRGDTSSGAATDSRPSLVSAFDRSPDAADQPAVQQSDQQYPSGGGDPAPDEDPAAGGGGQQYETPDAGGGGQDPQTPVQPTPEDPAQEEQIPAEQPQQQAVPSGQQSGTPSDQ